MAIFRGFLPRRLSVLHFRNSGYLPALFQADSFAILFRAGLLRIAEVDLQILY
jgi:hypothetical protein